MTPRSARFVVDQPGSNVALDLFVLDQHLGQVLDAALAPTGVSAGSCAVYSQLARSATTPGRLSETLGIRPTTLSGHLSAMRRSGHLSRVRNASDGRSWLLELTASGQAKADECRDVVRRVVRSIHAGLGSDDDVLRAREMLARLDDAIVAAHDDR